MAATKATASVDTWGRPQLKDNMDWFLYQNSHGSYIGDIEDALKAVFFKPSSPAVKHKRSFDEYHLKKAHFLQARPFLEHYNDELR